MRRNLVLVALLLAAPAACTDNFHETDLDEAGLDGAATVDVSVKGSGGTEASAGDAAKDGSAESGPESGAGGAASGTGGATGAGGLAVSGDAAADSGSTDAGWDVSSWLDGDTDDGGEEGTGGVGRGGAAGRGGATKHVGGSAGKGGAAGRGGAHAGGNHSGGAFVDGGPVEAGDGSVGIGGTPGTGGATGTGGAGGNPPACQTGACQECAGRGPEMVNVGTYCIDKTEVTNGQYQAWLDTTPATNQTGRCSWNRSFDRFQNRNTWETDTTPVIYVDWCDAQAFCQWAGKRLCGKTQWLDVCSSPRAHEYPYGATYAANACNGDNNRGKAVAVGSLSTCTGTEAPYNAVFDMSGNVEEWIDACQNGSSGDGSSDQCAVIGGGWYDGEEWLKCDSSYPFPRRRAVDSDPDETDYSNEVGFRCCSQ